MPGSRFLWKLYAGFAFLILATTAVVGFLISRRIEQDAVQETEEALQAKAALLRELALPALGPERSIDPEFQDRIRALGEQIGLRLTVLREDGMVLADSDEDPARMDNHADRQEVVAARKDGFGTSTRYSHTVGRRMMYVALRVGEKDRPSGYVRAALALVAIDERLAHLRAIVVFGAAAAAAAALILGYLFALRISRPLAAMTQTAEAMAQGHYEERIRIESADELGKLAEALNRLATSCQERMSTITGDRNQLLAILSGMVEGVVAVDREERVLHLNQVASRMLQIRTEASVGKRIWEVTLAREVCEALSQTLQEDKGLFGEIRVFVEPRERIVEWHTSPLRDGEGQSAGALVVLHDVTELRRLEGVRRDFVANVSHELKTPLTAIRGLVETLLDDAAMDAETQRRFMGKIRDQALRLSSLVTDLLTLSRVESQEHGLDHAALDLRSIVQESAKALHTVSEAKRLSVEVQAPASPVPVLGDREALRQVLDNLLDNAIKYTPEGGQIWLRVRSNGEYATAEVQDTGIGIEPRHQERIFERFYRVDKARSRELGGTGLGLSIVKHIALAHGGRISVESEPGKGSTFRVNLPRHIPPSS